MCLVIKNRKMWIMTIQRLLNDEFIKMLHFVYISPLTLHGDPSRCVLVGITDEAFVCRIGSSCLVALVVDDTNAFL